MTEREHVQFCMALIVSGLAKLYDRYSEHSVSAISGTELGLRIAATCASVEKRVK